MSRDGTIVPTLNSRLLDQAKRPRSHGENESPKPFIWTAGAADMLEEAKRARRTLNKQSA